MNKLVLAALIVVLMAGGLGYLSVLEGDAEAGDAEFQTTTVSDERFTDIEWKPVMESVPDYYTPPPPPKPKKKPDASGKNGGKNKKPKPKPTAISDARLMGVVDGDAPAALVALPNSNTVKRITVGEGWLEPWLLARVQADSVTWKNAETDKEHIQHLFR